MAIVMIGYVVLLALSVTSAFVRDVNFAFCVLLFWYGWFRYARVVKESLEEGS